MKETIIKVLFVAMALAAFALFIITGLWTDSTTMNNKKNTEVTGIQIP